MHDGYVIGVRYIVGLRGAGEDQLDIIEHEGYVLSLSKKSFIADLINLHTTLLIYTSILLIIYTPILLVYTH